MVAILAGQMILAAHGTEVDTFLPQQQYEKAVDLRYQPNDSTRCETCNKCDNVSLNGVGENVELKHLAVVQVKKRCVSKAVEAGSRSFEVCSGRQPRGIYGSRRDSAECNRCTGKRGT